VTVLSEIFVSSESEFVLTDMSVDSGDVVLTLNMGLNVKEPLSPKGANATHAKTLPLTVQLLPGVDVTKSYAVVSKVKLVVKLVA